MKERESVKLKESAENDGHPADSMTWTILATGSLEQELA